MMFCARYFGVELRPDEFRGERGKEVPSADALCSWARSAGMWSRVFQTHWQRLISAPNAGPVVLLLNDGRAALLTDINAEAQVAFLLDPCAPDADAVAYDQRKLEELWGGEVVLLRRQRKDPDQVDPPFTLQWLLGLVMEERKSFSKLLYASLAISLLTILPPLLVTQVVDKVITHRSYSTLFLISALLAIMVTGEVLLGYARRVIILVVGVRTDAKLNFHVISRLLRLSLDYFERHPAGETMYKVSQTDRVRQFITGKLTSTLLDLITLAVLLPLLFWLNTILACIVLVCATLIMLIIIAFLRPDLSRVRQGHYRREHEASCAGRDHFWYQKRQVSRRGAAA